MSEVCVKPELLTPKRVIELYQVYDMCGQIFEESTIFELFGHIAALTALIKQRDQQLIDVIKAI